jgi:hypothetical protein
MFYKIGPRPHSNFIVLSETSRLCQNRFRAILSNLKNFQTLANLIKPFTTVIYDRGKISFSLKALLDEQTCRPIIVACLVTTVRIVNCL